MKIESSVSRGTTNATMPKPHAKLAWRRGSGRVGAAWFRVPDRTIGSGGGVASLDAPASRQSSSDFGTLTSGRT